MTSPRRWILFAVTLTVYGVIVGWSLPVISHAAGGLTPFDLRPTGYSFEEAKAFLTALSADGQAFYLGVQQKLDALYPALIGATLFFAIYLLAPARLGYWRWVLALMAIPGTVFDYLENAAVAGMLNLGPDQLTPDVVVAASRWTVGKSAASTVASVVLLILLIWWAVRRFFFRRLNTVT